MGRIIDRPSAGTLAALAGCMALGAFASAQQPGQLFPQPFVVEHHLVQTDPDGGVFATDPVTDYYGGSWIVSVRPDGSRVVVDLARRELTEIRPGRGTYSTLSFDRFAELGRRLRRANGPTPAARADTSAPKAEAEAPGEPPVFRFERPSTKADAAVPDDRSALASRPGVIHLRVRVQDGVGPAAGARAVDVWLDPAVRLGARARRALARFESETLGAGGSRGVVPFAAYVAAAREETGGAVPVRTIHPLRADGEWAGTVEDVASRLEPLAAFPADLVAVPDGLRRVPHPLELMVTAAEEEADLRAGVPPGRR